MKLSSSIVQTTSLHDFNADPQKAIERVNHSETRIVVQKDGVAVAVLISAADLKELQQLELERDRDFAILDEIRETFKDIPAEEIEREAENSIRQVRSDRQMRDSTPR